jgi:hypothetical protein
LRIASSLAIRRSAFKRLESLHSGWGVPISDANQWIDHNGSIVTAIQRQIRAEIAALKLTIPVCYIAINADEPLQREASEIACILNALRNQGRLPTIAREIRPVDCQLSTS